MTFPEIVRDAYAALPDALASSELWQGGNEGFSATMDHVVDGTDLFHRLVFDKGALQISETRDAAEATLRVHGPQDAWQNLLSGTADPMDLLVHGDLVVDATTVDLVRQMQPFCLLFMIMAQMKAEQCST